jgi:hypothetical protein
MLNLLSPALFTNHRGQSKADAPSNRIWSRIKGETVSPDGTASARGIISNFQGGGCNVTNTTGLTGEGYSAFGDAGCGAVSQADGSGLRLTCTGTNLEANIISGAGVGGIGTLSLDSTLAFETVVKLTPAATTNFSLLAGVIEPGSGGNNAIVDTTGVPKASTDFVGFYVKKDNVIRFGYVNGAGTISDVSGATKTIVSGTSYKLGFLIDSNSKDELLKVFIDGVQVGQKTRAELLADAEWPDDTNFAAIVATKSVSGSASTADVKFAHCVQVS